MRIQYTKQWECWHTRTKNAFVFSSPNGIFSGLFICHSKSSENKVNYDGDDVWLSPTSRYNIICLRIERIFFVLVEMSNDKFDAFFVQFTFFKCSLEARMMRFSRRYQTTFFSFNRNQPKKLVKRNIISFQSVASLWMHNRANSHCVLLIFKK